jgi:hypothetical protein
MESGDLVAYARHQISLFRDSTQQSV